MSTAHPHLLETLPPELRFSAGDESTERPDNSDEDCNSNTNADMPKWQKEIKKFVSEESADTGTVVTIRRREMPREECGQTDSQACRLSLLEREWSWIMLPGDDIPPVLFPPPRDPGDPLADSSITDLSDTGSSCPSDAADCGK